MNKLKKLPEPRITQSELMAAMEEANRLLNKDILPKPPVGYFCATEFASAYGLSEAAARAKLRRLIIEKKLVSVKAFARDSHNRKGCVVYYGLPRRSGSR